MERDMSEVFNNQKLVEKLSKLNNSQQSIQTLSNWCIIHRKKAKNIVETWDIAFNNSPREKRVSFLYLANDILQNSRRVGNEFVNEFWKVLPGCLKNVYENGEDLGKKVVNRLVEIWDERKVFGSRGRGLKDEILGTVSAPVSNNGKSNSNPIKLIRKDSNSVRVKLALGEMPEKIVTAYQSVFDEYSSEDTALNKCTDAAQVLERMEKNIDIVTTQGDQQGPAFITDLQNQETVLKQCIEQLETAKSTRATLVYQLTEALKEQEFKLDLINDKLQISHSLSEHASSMRRRLDSAAAESGFEPTSSLPMSIPKLPPPHSVTSFAGSISSTEDDHKKAAAAVAAKLAASSSSAQVLSSILSSLAAEEAASLGNSLNSQVLSDGQAAFPLEKKPRLEKLISAPDIGMPSYFSQVQPQQHQSIPFTSQSNQAPPTFAPPLPPLPPLPPPPPLQQFAQTSGATNIGPFPFAPPLSHASLGFTRPIIPPVPPPPQQRPAPQQQSSSMGFYQSPGVGFYGQSQTAPTAQPQ